MAKRMLVDATHPEETRVVVVSGNRLEELDFEIASRKQLKGNIYLAKVIRVEPSLQAAFVEYGGNRHGFLAFSEIHPDYYRIPVADREALMREYERAAREEDEAPAMDRAEAEADSGDGVEEAPVGNEPVDQVGGTAPPLPTDGAEVGADGAPAGGEEGESPLAAAPEQESEAKPKGRAPRRTRKPKAAASAEAAAPDAAPAEPAEPAEPATDEAAPAEGEKKKPVRRRKPKTVAMNAEAPESVEEEVEEARKPRSVRPLKSYKIQEVIKRRQILLVQVTKEERGNKGAALTTYLSLPGRYCVLMPNTPRGGGISRKITNPADRKRLKELLEGLDIPHGMSVILRTAGIERSKPEIKRDLEYLMRLWDNIREETLQSVAPALIYEEANLIKRSIRDLYAQDVDEIWVEGEQGYRTAKDFMRMLMPSHTRKVQPYREEIPLFHRFQVEGAIETMFNPVVQLKSGGYIVINQTEALVAIDVNSGRSTKERNIEETALKTNLEAADEVARQLRLRDLAGLIVIDFIDMEESRNNASVEKRLKEAMKADRARIQLGRISAFGLLELSRQRLRPSLQEINFERCPHCEGTGMIRSVESAALAVLRAIEEEGIRRRSAEITVVAATQITLYILNQKRDMLNAIEQRYGFRVFLSADDSLIPPAHRLDRIRPKLPGDEAPVAAITAERVFAETDRALEAEGAEDEDEEREAPAPAAVAPRETTRIETMADAEAAAVDTAEESAGERANGTGTTGDRDGRRRRRRRRRRDGRGETEQRSFGGPADEQAATESGTVFDEEEEGEDEGDESESERNAGEQNGDLNGDANGDRKKRRRGKRGGRRRARQREDEVQQSAGTESAPDMDPAEATVTETAASESPDAETATPAAMAATADVAPAPSEAVGEDAAPKKRPSRSRKKAGDTAAQPEASPAPAETAAEPKKRPSRSRKKAAEAPAEEAPAVETAPAEVAAAEELPAAAAPAPVETAPEPEAEPVNPAIVVNPPVEKPKKGWWSRLVKE